jgi:hypothetical protein
MMVTTSSFLSIIESSFCPSCPPPALGLTRCLPQTVFSGPVVVTRTARYPARLQVGWQLRLLKGEYRWLARSSESTARHAYN